MRKFTRVFREVFERDIAKEIDQQKSGNALQMMSAKGASMKKTLDEELNEGETQLTKKMKEEKAEFVKQFHKHQIKASDEAFEKALEGKGGAVPGSISVAQKKKRAESDDEVEELE